MIKFWNCRIQAVTSKVWEKRRLVLCFVDALGLPVFYLLLLIKFLCSCFQICLDNKVDVNALDVHGSAALHTAAGIGDVGISKILLEAHANIDIEGQKCYGKRTPLFEAVMHRRLACMKTLLDHKANVNMGNRSKETPLFIASQHGDLESVQALLDAGRKLSQK